ncbi:hypothetical protein HBN50_02185 [Halobacteriovorax sp. GB3]|uniref:hypothetical protein n=1 Tax=Halobacteriovorax sp. GB3 TaxID=2719615 RepID=UPI002361F5F3|nr:hypothetical protein [Halobacteriovorax sp. GB3]MDD0851881.1 hypothetical protein [Halobacteriovorax sp. GB3]
MGIAAATIDELETNAPFYINSTYEGLEGRLYVTRDHYLFASESEIIHTIPFEHIISVNMPVPVHEKGIIEVRNDQNVYRYFIDDDATSAEEVYYYMKGWTLSKNSMNHFLKERVDMKMMECKKMFTPIVVSRMIETPNIFHPKEKVQAALLGRFSPSFSEHIYGVLVVTDMRIFFFDSTGILKSLERTKYKSLRIINCFDNFCDKNGRRTYSVEFNDSDFIVSVKTSRHIKIEMFHYVLEPEKELDESF